MRPCGCLGHGRHRKTCVDAKVTKPKGAPWVDPMKLPEMPPILDRMDQRSAAVALLMSYHR